MEKVKCCSETDEIDVIWKCIFLIGPPSFHSLVLRYYTPRKKEKQSRHCNPGARLICCCFKRQASKYYLHLKYELWSSRAKFPIIFTTHRHKFYRMQIIELKLHLIPSVLVHHKIMDARFCKDSTCLLRYSSCCRFDILTCRTASVYVHSLTNTFSKTVEFKRAVLHSLHINYLPCRQKIMAEVLRLWS